MCLVLKEVSGMYCSSARFEWSRVSPFTRL